MSSPVARLPAGSPLFNTIDRPLVRVFFQTSPGFPGSDLRGIADLRFRVESSGFVRAGQTGPDGKIEVPMGASPATLQLLVGNDVVSTYEITADPGPLDSIDKLSGQQQRLRRLGYQLGHEGPDGDGVGATSPRQILPPRPTPQPDPEDDEDDREDKAERKKKRRDNPTVSEDHFVDFTFSTERSILDFQADHALFADARVGPQTKAKLAKEGERS